MRRSTALRTPSTFVIDGGRPLHGAVVVNTAKNSAIALLCASLVNRGTSIFKRMPRIEEVFRMIEVLTSIGVTVRWRTKDLIVSPPQKLALSRLNTASAAKTRSVLMLLGPLLHWKKKFKLPYPGGCKLGRRTVRPHLYALERLGVRIHTTHGFHHVSVGHLRSAEIVMYESSDTATVNALLAASLIPGATVIKFASSNYQVQDVGRFLEKIGVRIQGIGTSTITISGVPALNTPVSYYPSEDPIEAMLFLSIAATTNSSLLIKRCPIDFLELELLKLEKMGFKYSIVRRYKARNEHANLVDIRTYRSKIRALEEKIYSRPFPGLNIDNLPFFVPVATQAKGTTLIHDWVYENRAIYYMELAKLGADIILADPHRAYVKGPTELRGAEVICPPALRPAVIILIAMLAARGKSILRNVYSINRGYENLVGRLRRIGASIKLFG